MRVLIAVTSCARDVGNGSNQAARDTWITGLAKYGYDYRFFVGVGSPPTDPTPEFQAQYQKYADERPEDTQTVLLDHSLLRGDEVLLDVGDSWNYHVYKVRESRRWALEHDYDFVFKIDTDTYLHASLLNEGQFAEHDFWGARNGEAPLHYAGGCNGYCLSRRACSLTVQSPINFVVEDVWTAEALRPHGIEVHDWSLQPTQPSPHSHGHNSSQWLREFHQSRLM